MTTPGEGGCRLLLEQLVGTGTVVTTGGRTCYDVVDTDCGAKFHGLYSMSAILECRVETEFQVRLQRDFYSLVPTETAARGMGIT